MARKAPEPATDLLPDCPRCGSPVELVTDGMIAAPILPSVHVAGRPLPYAWRLAAFGACTECEFCMEISTCQPKPNSRRNARV